MAVISRRNVLAAVIVLAALAPPAAQAASVAELFEKHGLVGTWALDCAAPASAENPYTVYRKLGTEFIQRDTMTAAATRSDASAIDRAAEVKPNELSMSMVNDRRRVELLVVIEAKRMRTLEMSIDKGDKLVARGRLVGADIELPWVTRCAN